MFLTQSTTCVDINILEPNFDGLDGAIHLIHAHACKARTWLVDGSKIVTVLVNVFLKNCLLFFSRCLIKLMRNTLSSLI